MHKFQSHYHTQQEKKFNTRSDRINSYSAKKKSTQDQIGSTHTQQKLNQYKIRSHQLILRKKKKINNSQIYIKKKKNQI
jgi:hypothetical protein